MANLKVIGYESWLSNLTFYNYAVSNPVSVPHLAVDRSICPDPYFDPFSKPKRPTIAGLCRNLKKFNVGDEWLFITKIESRVHKHLFGFSPAVTTYLVGAWLRIKHVYSNHTSAATSFFGHGVSSQAVNPGAAQYPPNLLPIGIGATPPNVISKNSCVAYGLCGKASIPSQAGHLAAYRHNLAVYVSCRSTGAPYVECEFVKGVHGSDVCTLNPGKMSTTPLILKTALPGTLNIMGLAPMLIGSAGEKSLRNHVLSYF